MIQDGQLYNYIAGEWRRSRATEFLDVSNPATAETIVRVPLAPADEVDEAVRAAQAAFDGLAAHATDRAHPVSLHAQEPARGALRRDRPPDDAGMRQDAGASPRASCGAASRTSRSPAGIPSLMMGYNAEDIARASTSI